MEENYSLNQQPQNPKPDHFTRIAFYKVGIIEAGILGIILLLIAGTLNYFNILPLSEMFPKYLSFLPRQEISSDIPTQQFTPKTTAKPTSVSKTLSSPEKETATQISQDFIDKFINLPYRDNISLEEKQLIIGGEVQPFPQYISSWEKGLVKGSLTLQYDFINRNPLTLNIILYVPTIIDNITPTSVRDIVGRYALLTSNVQFECDEPTRLGVIQCSSMQTQEDKSKVGFSLRANPRDDPAGARNSIILCQVFPSSTRYSWSSCLQP